MTNQADPLAQLSNALAARTQAAQSAAVAIRLSHGRHITGMVWQPDVVVASEQSLPRKAEFELVAPGGQVIVIPAATIERIVPLLLKDGRVARGWLGVALQAVAVPDALRETAEQSSGLMVMSVVEGGPAALAGILAGDIILSVDGTSAHRLRRIARHFGADSIGRKVDLRLIRGGAVIAVQAIIAERHAA